MSKSNFESTATRAVESLQQSLSELQGTIAESITTPVELITNAHKVVTTGLGKSGFIARKMAATLTSVRIPSVYIHPVDAVHGDSGILSKGDVLVAFSKSGETAEVVRLVKLANQLGIQTIGIACRAETTLLNECTAPVYVPFGREFDNFNVLPTSSTTMSMVVADILAVCAAEKRGSIIEHLQVSHPEGAIGSALLRTVDEVMHGGKNLPSVARATSFTEVVSVLSNAALGIVCVLDDTGKLLGIVTDGDVRRYVATGKSIGDVDVTTVMNPSPTTVPIEATLRETLHIMEGGSKPLNVLPVVNDGVCVGIVRLHDVVRANL